MARSISTISVWAARLTGIAFGIFVALFARDVEVDGGGAAAAVDLLLHLVPAALVLGTAALAWGHPSRGAIGFALLAVAYAYFARARADWLLVIAGPLAAIALLNTAGWMMTKRAAR